MGSGYVDAAIRRGFEAAVVERDQWFDTNHDRVPVCFPCAASTDEHWTAAAVAATRRWQPDVVLGSAEPQAPRGGHLLQSRRTPAAHARLEHPRAIPELGAAWSRTGKARCLLQPVLLYWLHERDA
jgi:hypothetical protein